MQATEAQWQFERMRLCRKRCRQSEQEKKHIDLFGRSVVRLFMLSVGSVTCFALFRSVWLIYYLVSMFIGNWKIDILKYWTESIAQNVESQEDGRAAWRIRMKSGFWNQKEKETQRWPMTGAPSGAGNYINENLRSLLIISLERSMVGQFICWFFATQKAGNRKFLIDFFWMKNWFWRCWKSAAKNTMSSLKLAIILRLIAEFNTETHPRECFTWMCFCVSNYDRSRGYVDRHIKLSKFISILLPSICPSNILK